MQFRGKLKDVSTNLLNRSVVVSFATTEEILKDINKLQDIELDIKAEKHREKRSIDANAYLWVLVTKMAEVLKSSKDEVYEELIQKYGYTHEEPIVVTVKSVVDMATVDGHWKYFKESKDGKWKSYYLIRGTSEYNTKEMAHFLDMVVQDAKDLDIDTLTPDELERIKATWKA